ncbi:MAG: transposase, partial [Chloroflexi bacterium]
MQLSHLTESRNMYKANKKHLQPLLISNVNDLPEKHRKRLEQSWAGTFYRDTFCRIPEDLFRVLYADMPSRPNVPVNLLVGIDLLKAQFGWSDEELYDHFVFDVQVRYALGLRDLKEGDFEIRTLYYFRGKLAKHYLESGENLLQKAFEQMTDQQARAHKVNLKVQRMDSTQLMSNIVDASRLQLLVEVIQRLARMLTEADQARYAELLVPYLEHSAEQFIYPVKGKEAWEGHLQQIGQVMERLVTELAATYGDQPIYQVFKRIFEDNYCLQEQRVQARANSDIPSGCLQSVDDLQATYRKKGPKGFKGYVANLTESCTPENDLQLITQVQVAPNNREDADLLAESMPELKARTRVESLYVDGAFGNPAVDQACIEQKVEIVQTGIRGNAPDPDKLNLSDFEIQQDDRGKPLQITCPGKQTVPVEAGRTTGFVARFDPQQCQACPFFLEKRCRAQAGKRDPRPKLSFTQNEVNWARRRKRHQAFKKEDGNLRAAVEATLRSLKHPFPGGKLPVRGLFRVTCMVVASAAMINMRRIHRFLSEKDRAEKAKKENQ